MSEYIKREDAYRRLTEYYHHTRETQHESLRIALIGIPSADVAPVKHGHWIKISPAGIYECSECGKNVMTSDIEAYEYCHGCGARMDGGDEDE